jgi:hypothetical protein
MEYKKTLERLEKNLIEEYSPLAVGIFGSAARGISPDSDVDMYVLKEHLPRVIKRKSKLIFEIYFESPENITKAISSREVRIIDRFRNSNAVYDPFEIYLGLIEQAKSQRLREEEWKEKTIIGGDYDLVERTSINIRKSLKEKELEPAIISIQYLMGRIIELGFRRLNISDYANPKKIPSLIINLPKRTAELYKEVTFSDIRQEGLIKKVMEEIEKNKLELLPLVQDD